MDKINTEYLFEGLLKGTLNAEEKEQLRAYISSCYKNQQLDETMRQHWDSLNLATLSEEPSLDDLKEKVWIMVNDHQQKLNKIRSKGIFSLNGYLVRIAAILFIPLLVYTGFLYSRIDRQFQVQEVVQEVVANPGSRLHFTLPDNTEVWLNSESSLEFPLNLDSQSRRNVKLVGQGYFKVSHDKKRPFFVETGNLKVKVLGTSFDVANYSNDSEMVSTLEEGSIAVMNKRGKEIAQLFPGEQLVFDKESEELNVRKVETELSTSWKDGYLIFDSSPLSEVVKKLQRWFNCSITVDPALFESDIQYTATIHDETIVEVLQMIELSTNVKTKIEKREVTIWTE